MILFKTLKAKILDDWCCNCKIQMEVNYHQLYMLPMMVGHYVSHKDAGYYIKNLVKVNVKKDIPTGYYACGINSYKCPNCGKSLVKLAIFLPVRDEEKYEEYLVFEKGELDSFIHKI